MLKIQKLKELNKIISVHRVLLKLFKLSTRVLQAQQHDCKWELFLFYI